MIHECMRPSFYGGSVIQYDNTNGEWSLSHYACNTHLCLIFFCSFCGANLMAVLARVVIMVKYYSSVCLSCSQNCRVTMPHKIKCSKANGIAEFRCCK